MLVCTPGVTNMHPFHDKVTDAALSHIAQWAANAGPPLEWTGLTNRSELMAFLANSTVFTGVANAYDSNAQISVAAMDPEGHRKLFTDPVMRPTQFHVGAVDVAGIAGALDTVAFMAEYKWAQRHGKPTPPLTGRIVSVSNPFPPNAGMINNARKAAGWAWASVYMSKFGGKEMKHVDIIYPSQLVLYVDNGRLQVGTFVDVDAESAYIMPYTRLSEADSAGEVYTASRSQKIVTIHVDNVRAGIKFPEDATVRVRDNGDIVAEGTFVQVDGQWYLVRRIDGDVAELVSLKGLTTLERNVRDLGVPNLLSAGGKPAVPLRTTTLTDMRKAYSVLQQMSSPEIDVGPTNDAVSAYSSMMAQCRHGPNKYRLRDADLLTRSDGTKTPAVTMCVRYRTPAFRVPEVEEQLATCGVEYGPEFKEKFGLAETPFETTADFWLQHACTIRRPCAFLDLDMKPTQRRFGDTDDSDDAAAPHAAGAEDQDAFRFVMSRKEAGIPEGFPCYTWWDHGLHKAIGEIADANTRQHAEFARSVLTAYRHNMAMKTMADCSRRTNYWRTDTGGYNDYDIVATSANLAPEARQIAPTRTVVRLKELQCDPRFALVGETYIRSITEDIDRERGMYVVHPVASSLWCDSYTWTQAGTLAQSDVPCAIADILSIAACAEATSRFDQEDDTIITSSLDDEDTTNIHDGVDHKWYYIPGRSDVVFGGVTSEAPTGRHTSAYATTDPLYSVRKVLAEFDTKERAQQFAQEHRYRFNRTDLVAADDNKGALSILVIKLTNREVCFYPKIKVAPTNTPAKIIEAAIRLSGNVQGVMAECVRRVLRRSARTYGASPCQYPGAPKEMIDPSWFQADAMVGIVLSTAEHNVADTASLFRWVQETANEFAQTVSGQDADQFMAFVCNEEADIKNLEAIKWLVKLGEATSQLMLVATHVPQYGNVLRLIPMRWVTGFTKYAPTQEVVTSDMDTEGGDGEEEEEGATVVTYSAGRFSHRSHIERFTTHTKEDGGVWCWRSTRNGDDALTCEDILSPPDAVSTYSMAWDNAQIGQHMVVDGVLRTRAFTSRPPAQPQWLRQVTSNKPFRPFIVYGRYGEGEPETPVAYGTTQEEYEQTQQLMMAGPVMSEGDRISAADEKARATAEVIVDAHLEEEDVVDDVAYMAQDRYGTWLQHAPRRPLHTRTVLSELYKKGEAGQRSVTGEPWSFVYDATFEGFEEAATRMNKEATTVISEVGLTEEEEVDVYPNRADALHKIVGAFRRAAGGEPTGEDLVPYISGATSMAQLVARCMMYALKKQQKAPNAAAHEFYFATFAGYCAHKFISMQESLTRNDVLVSRAVEYMRTVSLPRDTGAQIVKNTMLLNTATGEGTYKAVFAHTDLVRVQAATLERAKMTYNLVERTTTTPAFLSTRLDDPTKNPDGRHYSAGMFINPSKDMQADITTRLHNACGLSISDATTKSQPLVGKEFSTCRVLEVTAEQQHYKLVVSDIALRFTVEVRVAIMATIATGRLIPPLKDPHEIVCVGRNLSFNVDSTEDMWTTVTVAYEDTPITTQQIPATDVPTLDAVSKKAKRGGIPSDAATRTLVELRKEAAEHSKVYTHEMVPNYTAGEHARIRYAPAHSQTTHGARFSSVLSNNAITCVTDGLKHITFSIPSAFALGHRKQDTHRGSIVAHCVSLTKNVAPATAVPPMAFMAVEVNGQHHIVAGELGERTAGQAQFLRSAYDNAATAPDPYVAMISSPNDIPQEMVPHAMRSYGVSDNTELVRATQEDGRGDATWAFGPHSFDEDKESPPTFQSRDGVAVPFSTERKARDTDTDGVSHVPRETYVALDAGAGMGSAADQEDSDAAVEGPAPQRNASASLQIMLVMYSRTDTTSNVLYTRPGDRVVSMACVERYLFALCTDIEGGAYVVHGDVTSAESVLHRHACGFNAQGDAKVFAATATGGAKCIIVAPNSGVYTFTTDGVVTTRGPEPLDGGTITNHSDIVFKAEGIIMMCRFDTTVNTWRDAEFVAESADDEKVESAQREGNTVACVMRVGAFPWTFTAQAYISGARKWRTVIAENGVFAADTYDQAGVTEYVSAIPRTKYELDTFECTSLSTYAYVANRANGRDLHAAASRLYAWKHAAATTAFHFQIGNTSAKERNMNADYVAAAIRDITSEESGGRAVSIVSIMYAMRIATEMELDGAVALLSYAARGKARVWTVSYVQDDTVYVVAQWASPRVAPIEITRLPTRTVTTLDIKPVITRRPGLSSVTMEQYLHTDQRPRNQASWPSGFVAIRYSTQNADKAAKKFADALFTEEASLIIQDAKTQTAVTVEGLTGMMEKDRVRAMSKATADRRTALTAAEKEEEKRQKEQAKAQEKEKKEQAKAQRAQSKTTKKVTIAKKISFEEAYTQLRTSHGARTKAWATLAAKYTKALNAEPQEADEVLGDNRQPSESAAWRAQPVASAAAATPHNSDDHEDSETEPDMPEETVRPTVAAATHPSPVRAPTGETMDEEDEEEEDEEDEEDGARPTATATTPPAPFPASAPTGVTMDEVDEEDEEEEGNESEDSGQW